MARDRVGIVHDISRAISDMEGDLADTRQQVLLGYLTMIIYASFPATVNGEQIKKQLIASWKDPEHQVEISLKPVHGKQSIENKPIPDNAYVMTARGKDRIGFVATVSGFCAENSINILDLSTTVADSQYIMILMVDVSLCKDIHQLRNKLAEFNQDHEMNIVLQHHDIFKATNEIQLSM